MEVAVAQQPVANDGLVGVGDRLLAALKHLGLSQSEAARRLGMSPGFLSDVSRDKKRPGADLLMALRREMGISLDWLMTGEGAMFATSSYKFSLLRRIRMQSAVIKAAVVDRDPVAQELLELLLVNTDWSSFHDEPRFVELLERAATSSESEDLNIALYNEFVHRADPVEQQRELIRAQLLHAEARHRSPASELFGTKVDAAGKSAARRLGRI